MPCLVGIGVVASSSLRVVQSIGMVCVCVVCVCVFIYYQKMCVLTRSSNCIASDIANCVHVYIAKYMYVCLLDRIKV